MCTGDGLFNSSFVERGKRIRRNVSRVAVLPNWQSQHHLPHNICLVGVRKSSCEPGSFTDAGSGLGSYTDKMTAYLRHKM
jgi:hypothetical protein